MVIVSEDTDIISSNMHHILIYSHGFREIIPASWVRLFSAYEFQKLISGDDTVKG